MKQHMIDNCTFFVFCCKIGSNVLASPMISSDVTGVPCSRISKINLKRGSSIGFKIDDLPVAIDRREELRFFLTSWYVPCFSIQRRTVLWSNWCFFAMSRVFFPSAFILLKSFNNPSFCLVEKLHLVNVVFKTRACYNKL